MERASQGGRDRNRCRGSRRPTVTFRIPHCQPDEQGGFMI